MKTEEYYTISVTFDPSSNKNYTYKVPNSLKLEVLNYIVVAAPGLKVVQVTAIHEEKQDIGDFEYKFIKGTVTLLPPIAPKPIAPKPSNAKSRL